MFVKKMSKKIIKNSNVERGRVVNGSIITVER